jgi:hypothetical protein
MMLRGYIQLIKDAYRPKERPKRSSIIGAFLTATGFLVLLWLFVKGYPWILGFTLFSLLPFFVINMVYMVYQGYKSETYLQNNYFQIWKMSKSVSLEKRLECMKFVRELDDPYLERLAARSNRFSEVLLWVWLCVVLVGSLIIGIVILPLVK